MQAETNGALTNDTLNAIFQRRAIRAFDPVELPPPVRERILAAACAAPSSFNIQPYRFYWIQSPQPLKQAASLCLGQSAAITASALVVAVADIGSWRETNKAHLEWMRGNGFSSEKIADQEAKVRLGKWFFLQGWFGIFGMMKWLILRALHTRRIIGTVPVMRRGMFHWATKSTALACQNLMIAAEALGFSSCPMEGFDDLRLSKFLNLSRRKHQIIMVIAIGKKSCEHMDHPQWRRPLDQTVRVL
jgi:nitroreductase